MHILKYSTLYLYSNFHKVFFLRGSCQVIILFVYSVPKVSTLVEISQFLVGVPLHLPRFFFQRLQKTTLQLAVSPQQTNPNEPVSKR